MLFHLFHQVLYLPVVIVLFANSNYSPVSGILNLDQLTNILALLVPLIYWTYQGLPTRFNRIVFHLVSFALFLFLLNGFYFTPSVGILSCLLILFNQIYYYRSKRSTLMAVATKNSGNSILFLYAVYAAIYFSVPTLSSGFQDLSLLTLSFISAHVVASCFRFFLNLKKLSRKMYFLILIVSYVAFYMRDPFVLSQVTDFIFILTTIVVLISIKKIFRNSEAKYEIPQIFHKPEVIVISYFVGMALVGAFFLNMPFVYSSRDGGATPSIINSFFISMSAISVTGLSVLDIAKDFNFNGQFIILVLIQMGGLGITSLSAWIFFLLREKRINISHEETLQGLSGYKMNLAIVTFIKKIFLYFILMEGVGALVLVPYFYLSGEELLSALWRGIFTSVSAFCNAGFAIQSDSLIGLQGSFFALSTISFLIIAGGLSPLMATGLPRKIFSKQFNLQDKIVLFSTAFFLLFGFCFFLVVEWNYSLSDLSLLEKIMNSWFQSVTTRTAGFNAIDLSEARSVTLFVLMILMFIGGNPGSAAGGVKTVSAAVLAIAAFSTLREGQEAKAFHRMIPHKTIFRALLIVLIGGGVHLAIYFFLSVTQNISPIELLFETFSALGTVGLSLGATSQLDGVGKVIIIFSMLAGRVGPLTFLFLLIKKGARRPYKLPKEDVYLT